MPPGPAEYAGGARPGLRPTTLERMTLLPRLSRVLPVTLLAALVCWAATANNDDYCGTVGECLGTAFDDVVTLVVVVPLTGLALRLLRVPSAGLHTLVLLLVGGPLWYAATELLVALDPGRDGDRPLPLLLVLLVAVVTGSAGSYAAGPGGRWPGRALVPVVAIGLAVVAHLAADRALEQDRVAELTAVPVTLYSPRLAGELPDLVHASGGSVHLGYTLEVGGRTTYADVDLVPAPLEEELLAGQVALVRGDTVLVADVDPAALDRVEVLQALRDAPVETATRLARR